MSGSFSRLDTTLQKHYPNLSRSLIQKLIKNGYVFVDDLKITKTGHLLKGAERLELNTEMLNTKVEDVELDVLYEDENCVVVVKPAGVLSHSKGAFNPEPTVASWLKQREHYTYPLNEERGGIVHRLDRATSGVMICAKNKTAMGSLQKQFQNRTVKKTYVARVEGTPKPVKAVMDLPIERNPKKPQTFRVGANGKSAITEYEVVSSGEKESVVILTPKSGRTHQLRVHLNYVKHPIIGDVLYGGKKADRLYLHARSLEITIPGGIRKIFNSKEPSFFYEAL